MHAFTAFDFDLAVPFFIFHRCLSPKFDLHTMGILQAQMGKGQYTFAAKCNFERKKGGMLRPVSKELTSECLIAHGENLV